MAVLETWLKCEGIKASTMVQGRARGLGIEERTIATAVAVVAVRSNTCVFCLDCVGLDSLLEGI